MEMGMNKKIKNDFKDDVKCFFHELIKPTYRLKDIEEDKRNGYVRGHLNSLNLYLHKRRLSTDSNTPLGNILAHGLMFPFQETSQSSLIVRINPQIVNVFETKERAPYLFVMETIK